MKVNGVNGQTLDRVMYTSLLNEGSQHNTKLYQASKRAAEQTKRSGGSLHPLHLQMLNLLGCHTPIGMSHTLAESVFIYIDDVVLACRWDSGKMYTCFP